MTSPQHIWQEHCEETEKSQLLVRSLTLSVDRMYSFPITTVTCEIPTSPLSRFLTRGTRLSVTSIAMLTTGQTYLSFSHDWGVGSSSSVLLPCTMFQHTSSTSDKKLCNRSSCTWHCMALFGDTASEILMTINISLKRYRSLAATRKFKCHSLN